MVNEKYQDNLAETIVRIGVNLQPDQFLVINSPIETAEFARKVADAAFKAGAEDVYINYHDDKFSKLRLNEASTDVLKQVPEWWQDRLNYFVDRGAAIVSISAGDPDLLNEVDQEAIIANLKAKQGASEDYTKALMDNLNRWCVVSIPTVNWAKKVFPSASDCHIANDLLWNAILRATYSTDSNPIESWHQRDKVFKERAKWLNDKQFDKIRFQNDNGTDLTIGLPKNHIWSGGSEVAQDGVSFFPNLPTEEIYTAPDRNRVDGWVKASYPLVFHGRTIEDINLKFENGKVVQAYANQNENILQELLNIDENSSFLGEVALVPYNSPISDMNLLFYNTLFDENAACHLALGDAYPNSIEDGVYMTDEELKENGLNKSNIHVDFMIGTEDMNVTGINKDGSEEPIFINGDFVDH